MILLKKKTRRRLLYAAFYWGIFISHSSCGSKSHLSERDAISETSTNAVHQSNQNGQSEKRDPTAEKAISSNAIGQSNQSGASESDLISETSADVVDQPNQSVQSKCGSPENMHWLTEEAKKWMERLPAEKRDSVLASGEKYQQIKTRLDSALHGRPRWSLRGPWTDNGIVYIRGENTMIFHDEGRIIKELSLWDVLPFRVDLIKDFENSFGVGVESYTLQDILAITKGMKYWNPKNMEIDELLTHHRVFQPEIGVSSEGGLTHLSFRIHEILITCSVEEYKSSSPGRLQTHIFFSSQGEIIHQLTDDDEHKYSSGFISKEGKFFYLETSNGPVILDTKDFSTYATDIPVPPVLPIWFSSTKYKYGQRMTDGVDYKYDGGPEQDSIYYDVYDVEQRKHYVLARHVADNRIIPVSGFKNDGLYPLEGEPIYYRIKNESI